MPDFQRTDRTAFIARNLAPLPGTYTQAGTFVANAVSPQHYAVRVPMPASSTLVGWKNPHSGPVIVSNVLVYFSTAGTGTIDVGTGTAGTAANNAIIDGGTMAAIAYSGGFGATLGDLRNAVLLAGNGTAGDSVGVQHNEAATGTFVGTLFFNVTVI